MPYILDVDRLKSLIGFTPTRAQAEILANLRRTNIIISGRRLGKSTLAAWLAFRSLFTTGSVCWAVAPTLTLSRVVFDQVRTWCSRYFPESFEVNKADMTIRNVRTGSKIVAKSADSEVSLRGERLSLLIIDEAQLITDDIFSRVLLPGVAEKGPDGELGRSVILANPGTVGHWTSVLACAERPDVFAYKMPTPILDANGSVIGSNAPSVSAEELERIRKAVPSRIWEVEWMANFSSQADAVFQNPRSCIGDTLRPPVRGRYYCAGLDLGRKRDYTALVIVDMHERAVAHMMRITGVAWDVQMDRVANALKHYSVSQTYADETGLGDVTLSVLRDKCLSIEGVVFTPDTKRELIEGLNVLIESKAIHYPDDPHLIGELTNYGFRMLPSGKPTYGAIAGHDDLVCALALACKRLKPSFDEEAVMAQNLDWIDWFDGHRTAYL